MGLDRGSFTLLGDSSLQLQHETCASQFADVFVLGGIAAPRPLHFGGPFVLDSHAGLLHAQQRYASGQMGTLDGMPF